MSKSREFWRTRFIDGIWMPGDVNKFPMGFLEGHKQVLVLMELHTQHAFLPRPSCRDLPSLAQDSLILGSLSCFAYRKCTPEFLRAMLTAWKLEGNVQFSAMGHVCYSKHWPNTSPSASPACQPAIPCSRLQNTIPKAQPAEPGLAYI